MKIKYDTIMRKLRESDELIPGTGLAVDPETGKVSVVSGGGEAANAVAMTTSERTALVLGEGVIVWDTDLSQLFVGDGLTQGGTAVGFVPGYRLSDDGTALNFNPVQSIVNVTGTSVTLVPDTAYKMYATSGAVTINANPPASGYWGLESHIKLFIGSTGYIVTGTNVVLASALEPDAVNNCTVRFHDGKAIISVEDHVAGYVVTNISLYGEGSLYDGLDSAGNEYICVDASLNGQTLDLNGIEVFSTKHIVGNGYENTFVTGSADVISPSSLTLAALTLSGATVSGASDIRLADVKMENSVVSAGGTLFLDTPTEISYMSGGVQVDGLAGRLACTEIQSGGVVVVGDKLARIVSAGEVFSANNVIFESATQPNEGPDSRYWGGGHVLVLHMPETSGSPAVAHLSGCTIRDGVGEYNTAVCCNSGCSASFTDCAITGNTCAAHGVVTAMGTVDLSSCTIAGNIAAIGVLTVVGSMSLVSCTVSGNTCTVAGGQAILITEGGTATLEGCKLYDGNGVFISSGSNTAIFKGSNYFQSLFSVWPGSATVLIEEGATVDLTGNSYASPINPGAGVVVAGGDSTKSCTIINSAGASVSIVGGTYTKINNDGTTN